MRERSAVDAHISNVFSLVASAYGGDGSASSRISKSRSSPPLSGAVTAGAVIKADIRDVWKREDLGKGVSSFTAKGVGAHETQVLRLSPAASHY